MKFRLHWPLRQGNKLAPPPLAVSHLPSDHQISTQGAPPKVNKFVSILNQIMQGEMALATAVPVLAQGKAGNILGITLIAEESVESFLQMLAASKAAAAPAPAAPVSQGPVLVPQGQPITIK
jgi:hypothetical protein